ncbi:hypothetical protein [Rickettsiales endosymbiont of Stachyamoeba lipophora]|uniref:hypothetical protein n=1 Tax=Rickettsiales endosymbiont of Stachyamoeba lipophora TaxID=2486578 RepID=UPI000F64B5D1|nr:hypothetical protein [Rickettsiales endosymbiont of Stachyamoeba lipophora]AZL15693.1 hypothetical protein EF513_03900 [Rickettsiales endosymbiont of Stachyamoeba lipophora]
MHSFTLTLSNNDLNQIKDDNHFARIFNCINYDMDYSLAISLLNSIKRAPDAPLVPIKDKQVIINQLRQEIAFGFRNNPMYPRFYDSQAEISTDQYSNKEKFYFTLITELNKVQPDLTRVVSKIESYLETIDTQVAKDFSRQEYELNGEVLTLENSADDQTKQKALPTFVTQLQTEHGLNELQAKAFLTLAHQAFVKSYLTAFFAISGSKCVPDLERAISKIVANDSGTFLAMQLKYNQFITNSDGEVITNSDGEVNKEPLGEIDINIPCDKIFAKQQSAFLIAGGIKIPQFQVNIKPLSPLMSTLCSEASQKIIQESAKDPQLFYTTLTRQLLSQRPENVIKYLNHVEKSLPPIAKENLLFGQYKMILLQDLKRNDPKIKISSLTQLKAYLARAKDFILKFIKYKHIVNEDKKLQSIKIKEIITNEIKSANKNQRLR